MELTDSRFVVIQSVVSGHYLRYRTEADLRGYVSCTEEKVFSPYAKIEVEKAKIDSKFVHLRFYHSNKYLALHAPHTTDKRIVASAKQPEEDRSKWSCTMFEPIAINIKGNLCLRHVQCGGWLATHDVNFHYHVYVDHGDSAPPHAFRFVDWDTLVILPQNVAFKGDNEKFLKSNRAGGNGYLDFSSEDGNEKAASYEVTMQPDGYIRLKSIYTGKFWRRRRWLNWIRVDSTDTTGNDMNTLFWPIKVNDNSIALQNKGNNNFCCATSTPEGSTSRLKAVATSMITNAKFKVEELVLETDIYNVKFHMEDARIFDETVFVVGTGSATNNDPKSSASLAVNVSYQDATSSTFKCGLSLKTGVKAKCEAGIPCIVDGEIEISAEVTNSFKWNTTTTVTKIQEATYSTLVPPMSTVRVNYVAKKGKCNVPFSYTQRDKRSTDGKFITSQHVDGIYTGVNYYSFHFEQVAVESL